MISRHTILPILIGLALFGGMFLTGDSLRSYYDPEKEQSFDVLVEAEGERHVYMYDDRVGIVELEEVYYPNFFELSNKGEEVIFGFLPAIPVTYRVYVDPMILYKANYKTQELTPFFGSDAEETYPGYVTDVSDDEAFVVYLPYERKEPRGAWEIVLHRLETGEEKRFQIDEQYKEVGDAVLSPDGQFIAFAAHLGEKDPERGGVFKMNIETGEQEQIDWTDDGYFRDVFWGDDGNVEYEHNRINWEERG